MAEFDYVHQFDAAYTASAPSKKSPPLSLRHHFSTVTKARTESSVKSFYRYFQIPGITNLAGGLPNSKLFPFDDLEAQIAQPERWKPSPNDPSVVEAAASIQKLDSSASLHLKVPHTSSVINPLQKIDLTTALQYGTAQGYPPLYSFLRVFTRQHLHPNIPYEGGAEITLTVGSTDGMSKALECLSNTWSEGRDSVGDREGMLCEEFAYMNALQQAKPRGLNIAPVKIDQEGLLADGPGGLEDVLANWDESRGKRPHLLYTVTIGQNPTSGVLSTQRRKDIYAICSKYDVVIIEDDPYWYLQFPSAAVLEAQARGMPRPAPAPIHKFENSSGYSFLDSLVPSYLNIDKDGRVVRLDTFSKTCAPGCRLGWITAQPAVIERMLRIAEATTSQPSGFVQAFIAELIIGPQLAAAEVAKMSKSEQINFTGWKVDGWVRWLEGLRGMYERRMNRMCIQLEEGRYLLKQQTPIKQADNDWAVISKTKMYSFNWARGGMFVWIEIHLDTHPLANKVAAADLSKALWVYLTQKPFLTLVAPGTMFSPTTKILEEESFKFFRLCFAAAAEEEIEPSSKRFTAGVKSFWGIKDVKDLPNTDEDSLRREEGLVDLGLNWTC